MPTTSKATLALILMALVGCGPKPAPLSVADFNRDLIMERQPAPPPIDPNPYRFISGQRYGEGWDGNRIQRDGPTFKSKCGHDGECGCIGCASDGARTYCNHCDGGPFLPLE